MLAETRFAIDNIRHKHRLTICARDAFPAKGDIGDLKLHSRCHPERSRGIPMKLSLRYRGGILRLRCASLRMTEFRRN